MLVRFRRPQPRRRVQKLRIQTSNGVDVFVLIIDSLGGAYVDHGLLGRDEYMLGGPGTMFRGCGGGDGAC